MTLFSIFSCSLMARSVNPEVGQSSLPTAFTELLFDELEHLLVQILEAGAFTKLLIVEMDLFTSSNFQSLKLELLLIQISNP